MFSSRIQRVHRNSIERGVKVCLFACTSVSVLVTIGILSVLVIETFHFLSSINSPFDFLFGTVWTPLFYEQSFGVLPLVSGTVLIASIAMMFALPTGLLVAVYLSEYAPGSMRRVIKPFLEILAGIPTIVYGYFALIFVTPLLQLFIPGLAGFNALSPGLVMGIMILPMVSSLSEDALHSVPRGLREASLALGSSTAQTTVRVVIPAAFSGLSAATILSLSRAIGETMLVTIAAGQQPRLTWNPLVPVETMTAYIAQVSLGDVPAGSLEYQTIFAVAMLLFLGTFSLNIVSYWLRKRFREEYV